MVDLYPELQFQSLKVQLAMFTANYTYKTCSEVTEIMRNMGPEVCGLFSQVEALLRLFLNVPASSAEAEKSFSALRLVIDRYWVFITDTDNDYLHVYVPDNRYSEPIFIYCYKVTPFFPFSHLNNNKQLLKINILSCTILSSNYNNKNILFIKSIISNTDINSKQNNV